MLECGDRLQGTLAPGGEALLSLEGSSGDVVSLSFGGITEDGSFRLRTDVFGPDSRLVAENIRRVGHFSLPVDGAYSARVRNLGSAAGDYSV
jgi:hypothetical protein